MCSHTLTKFSTEERIFTELGKDTIAIYLASIIYIKQRKKEIKK
jgi:hypothetical protein